MADHIATLQAAAIASQANGWERCPGKPNGLRRVVVHDTPAGTPDRWWRSGSYESVEFLTFHFTERTKVPSVVHGFSRVPWIAKRDQKITFKRSLELLAQPAAESLIHS
jgi:hypothetical protein